MRSLLLTLTAGAGLIFLATVPASAITIATPAGVRHAADTLGLAETVHCRKYSHRHKRGHGWGRGCRGSAVSTGTRRRSGVAVRDGGRSSITSPGARVLSPLRRSPGSFVNPSNPQDRSGGSNRQDMTQPRAINPQDMR
jgi:hypothetical protein